MEVDITCYPSMGGSGIITTELGTELVERGYEAHFITSNILFRIRKSLPNMISHRVEVNQYAVFQYPPYDITLSIKIAEVIKRYDFDLLHMHYVVLHAICEILAREMSGEGIKTVTTLHGTDITVLGYDHSLQDAIKFGAEKSDIVTSVSKSLAQETHEIIGTNKETTPIYNFIRENEFPTRHNTALKSQLGIASNEKVLIHVSNFRQVKRIDTIIETSAEACEKIPSKLILPGDGSGLVPMRQLARELSVEEDVLFLGKQDCVSEFYQLSDLVSLLSERESSGLTLLEAMKTGVVPVGSNAGGVKEVIKHGEIGSAVDAGDCDSVSDYAIRLLEDKVLYNKPQKSMLAGIAERFGSEPITDQCEYYYQKMLNEYNKSKDE